MIYVDTSAAMKLVRPEAHSFELSRWLGERQSASLLSSVVIEVELARATRRSAPEQMGRADEVLRGIGVVALSPPVIARAANYAEPDLRSLDAIHLATAEHLVSITRGVLEAFVAYDLRLLAAARHLGMPVAAPGLT